jgi:hypothetical protein
MTMPPYRATEGTDLSSPVVTAGFTHNEYATGQCDYILPTSQDGDYLCCGERIGHEGDHRPMAGYEGGSDQRRWHRATPCPCCGRRDS